MKNKILLTLFFLPLLFYPKLFSYEIFLFTKLPYIPISLQFSVVLVRLVLFLIFIKKTFPLLYFKKSLFPMILATFSFSLLQKNLKLLYDPELILVAKSIAKTPIYKTINNSDFSLLLNRLPASGSDSSLITQMPIFLFKKNQQLSGKQQDFLGRYYFLELTTPSYNLYLPR